MRNRFKHFLFSGLEIGQVNALSRRTRKRSLLIITYHSVLPYSEKFNNFDYRNCVTSENFREQLKFLKKKYNVVTMKEAEERLKADRLSGYECVITFDDGFRNNHAHAMPLLVEAGLSAVFYISTAFIGRREMLWTEKVNAILLNADVPSVTIHLGGEYKLPLGNRLERENASVKVRTILKYKPWQVQENVVRELMEETGYEPRMVDADPERYAFMNWDEVREMASAGMEIGSHTHNHYLLNMLSEEESYRELKVSRERIEKELGTSCTLFSYPNGAEGNFLPVHFRQLEELGYSSAVTQIPGVNHPGDNIYALNRTNISARMDMAVFKSYLAGTQKLLTF